MLFRSLQFAERRLVKIFVIEDEAAGNCELSFEGRNPPLDQQHLEDAGLDRKDDNVNGYFHLWSGYDKARGMVRRTHGGNGAGVEIEIIVLHTIGEDAAP